MAVRMRAFDDSLESIVYWEASSVEEAENEYDGPGVLSDIVAVAVLPGGLPLVLVAETSRPAGGGPYTTINFDGVLDGNTMGRIIVEHETVLDPGAGAGLFTLLINGTTAASQKSYGRQELSGSLSVFTDTTSIRISANINNGDRLFHRIEIVAPARPFGRSIYIAGGFGLVGTNNGWISGAGRWDDAVTNIVSLGIECSVAGKIVSLTGRIYRQPLS